MKFVFFPPAALAAVLLSSCGAMNDTAATDSPKPSKFSLSNLMPSRVDVVEVRENELKEMPLGKERALAFEQERKRSFWSFVNFKEPVLPQISDEESENFSLLPPKNPG